MLVEVGENFWTTDGQATAESFGFTYRLRMCVVRLSDGTLWVWSPIAPSPALMDAVREKGEVAHIVAPNAFHNLHAAAWMEAFPGATLFGAPGLSKRNPALAPSVTLGEDAAPWDAEISTVMFRNLLFEEAVFFHHQSGTLVFTDVLQCNDETLLSGWRRTVARLDLMTGVEPHVPRKFRLIFRDKPALRRAVSAVKAFPAKALIVAHGPVVTEDVSGVLTRAFSWVK